MSITQFAMVEELASLIKDNYSSKHLVLAVEDALVKYLQGNPSPEGILELEPMSSYNRLIIHRLADIFGFFHESVGEGDDRHLVLQQCLETSMPSILVSDILWQHDASESPSVPYQLLKRDETCTVFKMNLASSPTFVEREAAYLAARERIFGVDNVELKEAGRQKPRNNPVVARRMIAHALGQRISQAQEYDITHSNELMIGDGVEKIKVNLTLQPEISPVSREVNNLKSLRAECNDAIDCSPTAHKPSGRNGLASSRMSMREENFGAAKRMFAHALGKQASKNGVSRGK